MVFASSPFHLMHKVMKAKGLDKCWKNGFTLSAVNKEIDETGICLFCGRLNLADHKTTDHFGNEIYKQHTESPTHFAVMNFVTSAIFCGYCPFDCPDHGV